MGSFSSKIGVLLAAAGSAIGLGSIWKFPYVVGENGGGAFIILYVVCSLVFGLPLVMNDFMIGRLSGKSAYGAFRALSGTNRWQWLSWLLMATVTLLTGFYFVVTGWCFYYLAEAAMNTFSGMDAEALTDFLDAFEHRAPTMISSAIVAIGLTAAVVWFDVSKGIERLSKILMPLLFVMLVVMACHMALLDGGTTGLRFLFEPDFSKLTPKVVLEAVGLSFFTLSVGLGILITYGSYMPKEQQETQHAQEENVVTTSVQMIALVLLVSLLAGMIVFPAVFAYGFSPAEGPELTFVTLPAVFQHMFSPSVTCSIFFALMSVAAITSTISMMEVMVAFTCEATSDSKRPLNRHQSVVVGSVILVLVNVLCVLSLTGQVHWLNVMGQNLFDFANSFVNNILIPVGALGAALFTGWFVPKTR
ncbi:MAG: sodium-dependent transporter, partial [Bacteroidaceae bacterium]|nr:sodium-dependent transporter [Bacteroidaceae bacterium]